jgi:8-oxo-dGTP diphosphatase
MTADRPLYERDPAAWPAHLAEGNARQARKRVSADVLLLDAEGRILLVDPNYKPDWDLPGGMAEANEPPHRAAEREIREELGLHISVTRALCIDWVCPHGPWDDLLAFIFECAVLPDTQLHSPAICDDELSAVEFCTQTQAAQRLRPHMWRRLRAALTALNTGQTAYLVDGHPLDTPRPHQTPLPTPPETPAPRP